MTEAERASKQADAADPRVSAGERGKGVYTIHTLGCQMNVHDSERIAGVLERDGYVPATEQQVADKDVDLIVLNTCAVRENATERMYGTVGLWAELTRRNPNLQIAVGGCMAQLDREKIAKRAPWVAAVFGTKNIGSLPRLLDQHRATGEPQVEVVDKLDYFPSQLPAVRASKVSSWVSISVGCNNTCTFCIVPTTRGKEHDRRPGDILDEVRRCVDNGAKEVTLLGQNVNSFGYGIGDRYAFSKLLRLRHDRRPGAGAVHLAASGRVHRRCDRRDGRDPERHAPAAHAVAVRLRPHPACDAPFVPYGQVHGHPAQGARGDARRADLHRHHRRLPGESDEDFEETMRIVEQARFSSAFTFEYSPRPGTPAAVMEQVPKDVVQERFERLVALQERITEEEMAKFEGRDVEVMITGTQGKKDAATHRVTGRERTGVLVHVGVPEDEPMPQVGDFVTATVTHAARHNLIADPDPKAGQTYHVRH